MRFDRFEKGAERFTGDKGLTDDTVLFVGVIFVASCILLSLGRGTSDTTEGIRTEGCIPVEAFFHTNPGDKIYLGDVSSDDSYLHGPKEDWAYIENNLGQILPVNEDHDGGSFSVKDEDIVYEENGIVYTISIGESVDAQTNVKVSTSC